MHNESWVSRKTIGNRVVKRFSLPVSVAADQRFHGIACRLHPSAEARLQKGNGAPSFFMWR